MTMRTPRKACDFCYRRKIKCDERKPRCTHCVAQSRDCTFTAPSRKVVSSRRQAQADLEARFRNLEASFQHLTKRLESTEASTDLLNQMRRGAEDSHALQRSDGVLTTPSPDYNGYYPKPRGLPTLQHISPIVEDYIQAYNVFLPLFDGDTLRVMVRNFYNQDSARRDPVAWAAIHVVLALVHRLGLTGGSSQEYAAECEERVQAVLSKVALGDIELLSIQVLLGMVTLLLGTHNLQPAVVLIGTTIRLAHKLGLHNRASCVGLSLRLARQRTCVFWIAYVLDKHISLRANTPSVQLDDDIDLDLPATVSESSPEDSELGIVPEIDGTRMSYFLCRIQLATIEGGVYDYLYSTRSQKRSPVERERALDSVQQALQLWVSSIPPEFSTTAAGESLDPGALPFIRMLHGARFSSAALIAQVSACTSRWTWEMRLHAQQGTRPHLALYWGNLVQEGRQLLTLFDAAPVYDSWNFWITASPHVTAVMLLATDAMCNRISEDERSDWQLVRAALTVMDKVIEDSDSDNLRSYRDTCTELIEGAKRKGAFLTRW